MYYINNGIHGSFSVILGVTKIFNRFTHFIWGLWGFIGLCWGAIIYLLSYNIRELLVNIFLLAFKLPPYFFILLYFIYYFIIVELFTYLSPNNPCFHGKSLLLLHLELLSIWVISMSIGECTVDCSDIGN